MEEAGALLDALGELLSDSEPTVRAAAAKVFSGAKNPEVTDQLARRLHKEPDPDVRLQLVKALAVEPNERSIPFLVQALTDPAGEVGWHAARALQAANWQPADDAERAAWHLAVSQFEDAVSCGAAAIEPLSRLTRSIAFQRCIRAVECLARIGGAQTIKPLLECLLSEDFTIRAAAARALGELGDARAFEPLVRSLRDGHHQVCLAACGSLGKMGDQRAAEPLIKMLEHSFPDVRTAAVVSLGKLRDSRAVGPVIGLLQDRDPDVREAAVTALGLIGNDLAIEPLVIALIDPESSIRQASAYALRRIEPYWERSEAAARAIPQLQRALKSHEYWVRQSAAEALKKLGVGRDKEGSLVTDSDGAMRKRKAVQSILVTMLADNDREFRQAAAEALGRVGLAESIDGLVERLTDTDRGVQMATGRALEALRWVPRDSRQKAQLCVALEGWSELVSIGADAVDAITGALAWNEPNSRRRAFESLVRIGGPRVISTLRGLTADPAVAIREQAAAALSVLENPMSCAVAGAEDAWGKSSIIS